uniref:Uncharacterized protein n=1 Tax=Arundo donax TaxID=35708 RepID=A0A0A9ERM2_ARUDO
MRQQWRACFRTTPSARGIPIRRRGGEAPGSRRAGCSTPSGCRTSRSCSRRSM